MKKLQAGKIKEKLVKAKARKAKITRAEAIELAMLKNEFARLTGIERKYN